MAKTDFESQALILGQLWANFKGDEDWSDFFDYNDVGLPLAFAYAEEIITHTPELERYINETWNLFIHGLGMEDTGFSRLEDIFVEPGEKLLIEEDGEWIEIERT
jgi:hypothetical protein